jgi:hypothetical protein
MTSTHVGVVVGSPMGRVGVLFAPRNGYGALDHDVTLPPGEVVTDPVRVLAHPDGAEIVFALRRGDASDADFAGDVAAVQEDLIRLKGLLEQ